jgi:NAD(P)-dependent dehydrogenase (short-subunit alcohol dehydrogenase family)
MGARFSGKVVVVTGGNSGIGRAASKAFAEEGATVVIAGRDPKTLASAAAEIGPRADPVECDVSDLKQIDRLMDHVRARHGRIDSLFVNHGVGHFQPVEEVREENWDRIMNINLKGVFFTVQKALPLMRKGGTIVLNASLGWKRTYPGNSVYSASKAGVRALGRNFARELVERGIRVNVLSPGPIDTPITGRNPAVTPEKVGEIKSQMAAWSPMKRLGTSDEAAKAVLFLASEDSSYTTGIDLLVDGGIGSF